MKLNYKVIAVGVVLIIGFVAAYQKGMIDGQSGEELALVATAEAKKQDSMAPNQWSPIKPYPKHNVYYPGTDDLKPDEMRVIALGSGMPMPRRKQASAAFAIPFDTISLISWESRALTLRGLAQTVHRGNWFRSIERLN